MLKRLVFRIYITHICCCIKKIGPKQKKHIRKYHKCFCRTNQIENTKYYVEEIGF